LLPISRLWCHYAEASRLREVRLVLLRIDFRFKINLRFRSFPSFLYCWRFRSDIKLRYWECSLVNVHAVGNSSIQVFHGPPSFRGRQISSSGDALLKHKIEPISLASKEHLGILNGTAFSASLGALAVNEAAHLCFLAQVCTAMGTEALRGTIGSYDSFIHAVARPHPGQVSVR
jgi:hypothetical protein